MPLPTSLRTIRAALLLTAVALSSPAFSEDAPATYPSDGGIAAKIQPFVDNNVIPGAVILVANKDKVLDVETVGYSDFDNKVPIKTDALFAIASMSKTLTSVGLMMLVDEGKVNLDDPVEKYLPAFQGQMVVENGKPPHPPQHPITVREVMSHTSGIHKGTKIHNPKTTIDAANQIAADPLDWEPGTKYLYSLGPVIGGAIIEVVSGKSYPDFIKERILDPLGMHDTTAWPTEAQAPRLALTASYNSTDKKLENHKGNPDFVNDPAKRGPVPARVMSQMNPETISDYNNHFAQPAGGWFSTAADFSIFSRMLLNDGTYEGKKYLSPEAVKEMSTVQTKNFFPGNSEGYGLGTFVQKNPSPDGPAVGSYGHRGARKTFFWVDPTDQLVLIFMTQRGDNPSKEDQKAIYTAFIKTAIEKYGTAPKASAASAPVSQK